MYVASVLDLVQISLSRNGTVVPVTIQRALAAPHRDSPYLNEHEGFGMSFIIQRDDGLAFDDGQYLLSVSFATVVPSLKTVEGVPWQGQVQTAVQRRLDIRRPRDRYELRAYWRIEGNDRLLKRQPYDAIRLLEPLAHEAPDDWQAHMALGAAYLQTTQYERPAEHRST